MTKLLKMLLALIQKFVVVFLVAFAVLASVKYLADESEKLPMRLKAAENAASQAKDNFDNAKRAYDNLSCAAHPFQCSAAKKQLKSSQSEAQLRNTELEDVKRSVVERQDKLDNWLFRHVVPALLIALSLLLVPQLTKIVLYFWLAPMTEKRVPLRLVPEAGGNESSPSGGTQTRISAVSQSIVLNEGEELLVHPEYLQSTPQDARKRTQLFLNRAIPFSSLSAGLFLLTRIADAGSEPIVVSSTKDALGEVGILELHEGDAFVCHARALAGIIQDSRKPMRISRQWCFNHPQSWLTLQFRYIVFHGPGKLIIKGCRGIRMETATRARLINQSATLGFSANLGYSSIRCETFMSYLTGQEDLLNDRFFGEPGVYVLEEIPVTGKGGVRGRLEGVIDSILKVFGV